MKKTLIYIVDDVENVSSIIEDMIKMNFINCDVKTFSNIDDFLNDSCLHKVDLFIIDMVFSNDRRTGKDISLILNKEYPLSTFLFISGYNYTYNSFNEMECVYDFIDKPFDTEKMVNKIKILLKVSTNQRQLHEAKTHLEYGIWDLFNHSTAFYVLILNEDMTIKTCNVNLASELGYEDKEDIIGEHWSNFLHISEKNYVKEVFNDITEKYDERNYEEVNNKILTRNNKLIPVKWFNSAIINGSILTFSMGIPLDRIISPEQSVANVRTYWREIIKTDRNIIQSLRDG